MIHYWLFKSEPSTFSIDDLAKKPKQQDHWDGVRNYQARNFMRDNMRINDLGFFYHSSCEHPGIVGIVKIVRAAYPDDSALNPDSPYYDPKSTSSNPRWFMVDVQLVEKFKQSILLSTLKAEPALAHMRLLQKGNRLSILPVTKDEWDVILKLMKSN